MTQILNIEINKTDNENTSSKCEIRINEIEDALIILSTLNKTQKKILNKMNNKYGVEHIAEVDEEK